MLFIKRFLSSANSSIAASRERTTSIIKRYTKNHEWISYTSLDGPITLGISDYGQKAIGDLVYVEVCKDGGLDNNNRENNIDTTTTTANNNKDNNSKQQQEKPIAIVEGVKGATDVYCPFRDYKIIDINENVIKRPSLINKSPEEEGYLLKFLLNKSASTPTTKTTKTEDLLNGDEYMNFCKGQ